MSIASHAFWLRISFYGYRKSLQASPAWCPLPATHSSSPHRRQFLPSSLLGGSPFKPGRLANTAKDALAKFLPPWDFCLLSALCHCHCWHWCSGSSIGPRCGFLSQKLWREEGAPQITQLQRRQALLAADTTKKPWKSSLIHHWVGHSQREESEFPWSYPLNNTTDANSQSNTDP